MARKNVMVQFHLCMTKFMRPYIVSDQYPKLKISFSSLYNHEDVKGNDFKWLLLSGGDNGSVLIDISKERVPNIMNGSIPKDIFVAAIKVIRKFVKNDIFPYSRLEALNEELFEPLMISIKVVNSRKKSK